MSGASPKSPPVEHAGEGGREPLADVVALACLELSDVDVKRDAWLGVTSEALHLGDVGASPDQVRDGRMAQVVETQLGQVLAVQASPIRRLLEATRRSVPVVNRLASECRENEVVVL